jgi:Ca-activated chloride channel family protein
MGHTVTKKVVSVFVYVFRALLNPKMGTKIETVKRQGIDIVLQSMFLKYAEDIAPSRLERVNNWFRNLSTN